MRLFMTKVVPYGDMFVNGKWNIILLISVNCKYDENKNYLKNDNLNETEMLLRQRIMIKIIVKPERKRNCLSYDLWSTYQYLGW